MNKTKQGTAQWFRRTHLFHPDEFICSSCGYTTTKRNLPLCPRCSARIKRPNTTRAG